MKFIHFVQVEILALPVYVHDLEQDNCMFIPEVLYTLLLFQSAKTYWLAFYKYGLKKDSRISIADSIKITQLVCTEPFI